jgi:hypothetical protein
MRYEPFVLDIIAVLTALGWLAFLSAKPRKAVRLLPWLGGCENTEEAIFGEWLQHT